MGSQSGGMMAAPNESTITAKLLSMKRSEKFSDKWLLELDIQAIESVHGPTFARAGQRVKAFAFDVDMDTVGQLAAGMVITVKAEYLGDARDGQFQLKHVEVVKETDR
ncbi:hypothetical protein [Fodinibius sediminis]|nr:hypothetical protein [Fodinibius sediminis]